MPKAKDTKSARDSAPRPKTRGRKGEAAFDVWLQKGLHEIYDGVAREPIPEELLKLIEEDRKR